MATLPFIQDLQATTPAPAARLRGCTGGKCPKQLLRPTRPTGETQHSTARHGTALWQSLLVLQPTPKEPGLCPDPKRLPLQDLTLARKTKRASGQSLRIQESHRLESCGWGGLLRFRPEHWALGAGSAPPCRSSATVQERDLTSHKCLACIALTFRTLGFQVVGLHPGSSLLKNLRLLAGLDDDAVGGII